CVLAVATLVVVFVFESCSDHRDLHSFPTRRSSDLADLIKIAMIRIAGALKEQGLGSRMILQVHDELVVEVPRGEEEVATELVKRDRKSTRLNSSHTSISYAVFRLQKKKRYDPEYRR